MPCTTQRGSVGYVDHERVADGSLEASGFSNARTVDRPTAKQHRCLPSLADKTGTTFTPPRTRAEAPDEIRPPQAAARAPAASEPRTAAPSRALSATAARPSAGTKFAATAPRPAGPAAASRDTSRRPRALRCTARAPNRGERLNTPTAILVGAVSAFIGFALFDALSDDSTERA